MSKSLAIARGEFVRPASSWPKRNDRRPEEKFQAPVENKSKNCVYDPLLLRCSRSIGRWFRRPFGLNREQFHFKYQRRVCPNRRPGSLRSVGQFRWHIELPFR